MPPKTLDGILKKYFYAPPMSEGFAKGTCMVCGTPLEEKDWQEQRNKAKAEIVGLLPKLEVRFLSRDKLQYQMGWCDGRIKYRKQTLINFGEELRWVNL